MLVLGWLTVMLGVLAMLLADGAFVKRGPQPGARRAIRQTAPLPTPCTKL